MHFTVLKRCWGHMGWDLTSPTCWLATASPRKGAAGLGCPSHQRPPAAAVSVFLQWPLPNELTETALLKLNCCTGAGAASVGIGLKLFGVISSPSWGSLTLLKSLHMRSLVLLSSLLFWYLRWLIGTA